MGHNTHHGHLDHSHPPRGSHNHNHGGLHRRGHPPHGHRRRRSDPRSPRSSHHHHRGHGHGHGHHHNSSSLRPLLPHETSPRSRRQSLLSKLRRIRKLAAAGDPEAMYELGNFHYRGLPHGALRRNKRTGYVWFRRSADGGSPRGMAAAGALLVNGAECAEEIEEGMIGGVVARVPGGGGWGVDGDGNAINKSRRPSVDVVGETDDDGSGGPGCVPRPVASSSSLPRSLVGPARHAGARQGLNHNNNDNNNGPDAQGIRHPPPRAPSLSEGMSLLGAAAASGSALACFWLGQCHLDGTYGLPVNLARSRTWLSKVVRGECPVNDLDGALATRAGEMLEELEWTEREEREIAERGEEEGARMHAMVPEEGAGGGAVSSSSSSEDELDEYVEEEDVTNDSGIESDDEDAGESDAATVTGGATTDCEEESK
uniref:Uncharacterized protein n=1 Tax=Odontella aurita TaxID=265563 RepID=A0A6U6GFS6_9STRA